MIAARGLSREYDGRPAVDDLSFELAAGRLCALLGPNGAGKTTTVRMLLGLLPPTRGTAEVAGVALPAGRDAAAALRARAGLLTETPGFYDRLSGLENLELFGSLYRIPGAERHAAIERWLRRLDLWEARDRPFGTWSRGMKQRLALIRAVLHEPSVIFLDEPTAGLDPAAARDVRGLIAELRRGGRTILLCTHHLGEAQQLADVIGILQRRLLAFGTLEELTGKDGRIEVRLAAPAEPFLGLIEQLAGVRAVRADADRLRIDAADPDASTPGIVAALAAAGAPIREVRPMLASLEEIYLRAVGEEP
ncbi:MAG: ABC transporter ATP-binding protein [Gemmatimonadales bacterium]